MRRWRATLNLAAVLSLAACARPTASPPAPATAATPAELAPEPLVNDAYTSLTVPLMQRSAEPSADVDSTGAAAFSLHTGDFRLELGGPLDGLRLTGPGAAGLSMQPFGPALDVFERVDSVSPISEPDRPGVVVAGSSAWMSYRLWLWVYPHNPGLLRYHLELTTSADVPNASVEPEWMYIDPATGEETAGKYTAYADRASFASPSFYGYSAALGATLLHWVDITRLNPFIEATGFSPATTPVRQGRRFGHDLSASALAALPAGSAHVVYDSYLYLAAGEPADEPAMYLRYLQHTADIYDLIAHPLSAQTLPDWQALAGHTLTDLDEPDTFVTLNGQRYWRAYVGDTRQSAEAITQLDVGLAAARYAQRYPGLAGEAEALLTEIQAGLPDFFNPDFGLIQNSGPLAVTGSQGRGDTWYELQHALKAA